MSIYRHQDTGEVEFFNVEQGDDGEFLKTSDVLNLLAISETTLNRRIRKGVITPHHTIRRGSVITNYYHPNDVKRLRDGH